MRRLRFLIAALILAVSWSAHALTIEVDADLLKDASGNPMPTTGLAVLVASTDNTFGAPTPLSFVSGDDIVVGKLDLSKWGQPGAIVADDVSTTGILGKPLMLFWYPTLNINSTAPGQNAPYGSYTDPVGIDGSAPWFGGNDGDTISIKFLTTDATAYHIPGSNPPSAGLATNFTATPIVINSQPANTTQSYGGTATFSVNASGTALVYKWQKNGTNLADGGNVSGSTTSALTLSNLQGSDAASYSVFITNSSAFTTSSNATLSVIDPAITSGPTTIVVQATQTAHFSVVATGSGTLSYQWRKANVNLSNGPEPDGAVVSGATTSALTIAGVQQDDAGQYTVLVTGSGGTTTSSGAVLNVDAVAPEFSIPSADSTSNLNAGDSITLSASATGSTPIFYQWKKGVSNLADGTYANGATVSGATTANLTLSSVLAADAGIYVCEAQNGVGDAVRSHSTTINVNDPIITVQPVNTQAECGTASTCLTVTAIGSTNLTYQWYSPDPSGTPITDGTNASLCFNNISFANAGSYSVVVSNGFGNSITSSVAVVTVTDVTAPDVILNGSNPVNIPVGTAYTEAGAIASDSCDGSLLVTPSGNVDTNTVGSYTITYTATDSHGNPGVNYRVVNVQVVGDPGITSQPQSLTVVTGQKNFSMSVSVAGTPSPNPKLQGSGGFRYQWYFINTNSIFPGKPMAGATNATLLFKNPTAFGNAGTYYCYITNAIGKVYTDSTNYGKLTVWANPTVGALGNVKKIAGNIATFKAIAGPAYATRVDLGGPLTFSWFKNGSPITTGGNILISNADNGRYSSLIIDNIQIGDAATYTCTVGNQSPVTATTKNDGMHGVLTVNPEITPSIGILHPSANLHYTNGLASKTSATVTQDNIAPELDIDGLASDRGRITDVTVIRTQDNALYHSPFVYRTNGLGAMLPGSVRWTNHVTLLDGTNTFQAFTTNTANLSAFSPIRTYYMCTPVTVTINVIGNGTVTGLSGAFGKPTQGVNNNLFNQLSYRIIAVAHGVGNHFVKWTDENGNTIPGTSTLTFTAANNMVINANFLH